jgi:hypothetical protein
MPKSKKETKKVTVIGRVEFVPNLDYQENCKYDKNGSLYCNVKFRIKNQKELDRYQIAIQGTCIVVGSWKCSKLEWRMGERPLNHAPQRRLF